MRLHEIIRTRRQALGLTQEQLAQKLGVSAPAVNKWERALNYPDITLLPALARALVRHLGTLDCVALMTTHYDGVSDVAGAHYQVAGLVRDIQGDEGDDPRKRIARRMDYRLLPAPPGAPCPRDALRVCRLLKLDSTLMELFQADL